MPPSINHHLMTFIGMINKFLRTIPISVSIGIDHPSAHSIKAVDTSRKLELSDEDHQECTRNSREHSVWRYTRNAR